MLDLAALSATLRLHANTGAGAVMEVVETSSQVLARTMDSVVVRTMVQQEVGSSRMKPWQVGDGAITNVTSGSLGAGVHSNMTTRRGTGMQV